jgi:hypothetical protein
MFCAPGLIFGGTEGVGSSFHVLRSLTRFRRYRERRVPFSHFARPDSFSTVPRVSGPLLFFCAPAHISAVRRASGLDFIFCASETHFRRYLGCRFPFSCFARPDSFSAVPRASSPIFTFCALVLVFSGTEGVESCFHVLRSDSFSAVPRASGSLFIFVLPDSFSAVLSALGLVFMFCAPGLHFGGTEGVRSRFHVFRSRTRLRR